MVLSSINMLTWAALAVLVVSMIIGLATGLVRTVFSTFSVIIVMVAATFGAPALSSAVQTTWLGEQVRITIEDTIFGEDDARAQSDEAGEATADSENYLDELNLPPVIRSVLEDNSGITDLASAEAEQVKRAISTYLTDIIIKGVCFILIAFVVWIFLTVLVIGLDLVAKLPVLHTLNHLGGLLFGLVRGYLILWILFAAITAFSGTGIGAQLYAQINESPILTLLFNSNLPIRIMNTFF